MLLPEAAAEFFSSASGIKSSLRCHIRLYCLDDIGLEVHVKFGSSIGHTILEIFATLTSFQRTID